MAAVTGTVAKIVGKKIASKAAKSPDKFMQTIVWIIGIVFTTICVIILLLDSLISGLFNSKVSDAIGNKQKEYLEQLELDVEKIKAEYIDKYAKNENIIIEEKFYNEKQIGERKNELQRAYESGENVQAVDVSVVVKATTTPSLAFNVTFTVSVKSGMIEFIEDYQSAPESYIYAYLQTVDDTVKVGKDDINQAFIKSFLEENCKLKVNDMVEEENKVIITSEIEDIETILDKYWPLPSEKNQELRDFFIISQQAYEQMLSPITIQKEVLLTYNNGMFQFPAPYFTKVTDDYGWRMDPLSGRREYHNGIDLGAPGGTPILAAYDGIVSEAGYNYSMGNYVKINHKDGMTTIYMHASVVKVNSNNVVKKGETIATVGSTGRSTGNHLHFAVQLNGNYVNPWTYFK